MKRGRGGFDWVAALPASVGREGAMILVSIAVKAEDGTIRREVVEARNEDEFARKILARGVKMRRVRTVSYGAELEVDVEVVFQEEEEHESLCGCGSDTG